MTLPRWLAHFGALFFGYFWMSCPKCGRMFAGFESKGVMWHSHAQGLLTCCLEKDEFVFTNDSDVEVSPTKGDI